MGGCTLEEWPENYGESDDSSGSVSQESIIGYLILMIAGRTPRGGGGRTVGSGVVTRIIELTGLTKPQLVIQFTAAAGLRVESIRAMAAQDVSGLDLNPAGCPRVGKFPGAADPPVPVPSVDVVVPLEGLELSQSSILVVHGDFVDENGNTESAWGADEDGMGQDIEGCDSTAMVVPIPPLEPAPGIAANTGTTGGIITWSFGASADPEPRGVFIRELTSATP